MYFDVKPGLLPDPLFNAFSDVGECVYFDEDGGYNKLFSLLLQDAAGGVGLIAELVDQLLHSFADFIAHTRAVMQDLIHRCGMNAGNLCDFFYGYFHGRHLAFGISSI